MNQLIKISTNEEGKQLVSARELHEFLEVNSRYNDWISNRIKKYGFEESVDYTTLTKNLVSGGKEYDHVITTEMAKELSMVENNEKGREARKYFIKCEKALKENVQTLNTSELSPELQMFNQMFKAIANNELEQKKLREEMQGIRDIVSLSPNAWRKDTTNLINQIARKLGGD